MTVKHSSDPLEAVEHRDSENEAPARAAPAPPVNQQQPPEYLKIHIGKAYKSVKVDPTDTVQTLIDNICDKLALPPTAKGFLEVEENIQGKVERLLKGNLLLERKRAWPKVLTEAGNQTNEVCFFQVVLRPGTPPDVSSGFNAAAGL